MREIIFRGKRIASGQWVEGDLIHGVNHKHGKVFILPIKNGIQSLGTGIDPIDGFEIDPETVGQYTGLKDKNDARIFEGDVLEYSAFYPEEHRHKDTVRFEDGYFSANGLYEIERRKVVAIDNIHDNPELLK